MPRVRLFELLIKVRADQLNRETGWDHAIQARAKVIAEREGRTGPIWEEAGCLMRAEGELKSEDAREWRQLAGDRFFEDGVWRFRTTPWDFVVRKLQSDRAMSFDEATLFEAVRLVQLEQGDDVDLAIRQFIARQDDNGYTDELLAGLWGQYRTDAEAIALEKPYQTPPGAPQVTVNMAVDARQYTVNSQVAKVAGSGTDEPQNPATRCPAGVGQTAPSPGGGQAGERAGQGQQTGVNVDVASLKQTQGRPSSRDQAHYKWLAEAMLLVNKRPDWPDCRIAEVVEVHPGQLSRSPEYQAAAKLARDGGYEPPRGQKEVDRGTKSATLEALHSNDPRERVDEALDSE